MWYENCRESADKKAPPVMSMAHQLVQMAMIRMKGGSASVEGIRMPVNRTKTVALIIPLEETTKEIQGLEDHCIQLVMSMIIEIMEITIANEIITTTIRIGETTTTISTVTATSGVIETTISITTATTIVKAVIRIRDTVAGLLHRIIPGMLRILDNRLWHMVAILMILPLQEGITVILQMEDGKELLHPHQDTLHMEITRTDTIMARIMHHLLLAVMVVRLQWVLNLAQAQVTAMEVMLLLSHLNTPIKR